MFEPMRRVLENHVGGIDGSELQGEITLEYRTTPEHKKPTDSFSISTTVVYSSIQILDSPSTVSL